MCQNSGTMVSWVWRTFLISALFVVGQSAQQMSDSANGAKKILDEMFQQYDKSIRPNYGEKPTEIGVTAEVLSIDSVDSSKMEFTFSFYLRQKWDDPRLAFRSQFSRGRGQNTLNQIVLERNRSNLVWKPNTFFVNEKIGKVHAVTGLNQFMRVDSNGSVFWSERYTVTAGCQMNLRFFPFDSQSCTLDIESFETTMNDTIYYWGKGEKSVKLAEDISLPGLHLTRHMIQTYEISSETGKYSRLALTLEFRRSYGYYIIRNYIPMAAIVLISLLTLLFANPLLEPLIHVITLCFLIWYNEGSWLHKLPMVSYINALYLYFLICVAHLLLSLFVSLAAAFKHMRQAQQGDSVCSICKPLTELDNYRGTNSRRSPTRPRSCTAGSAVCYFFKLLVIGLFIASNILYWIFYRSILLSANRKLTEVGENNVQ